MWTVFTSTASKDPAITLSRHNPQYSTEKDLESFTIAGVAYKKESSIAKKRKAGDSDRLSASSVWKEGVALRRQSDDKKVFYCYHCECQHKPQQWPSLYGTSTAWKHLKRTHGISDDNEDDLEPKQERLKSVSTERYDTFKRLLVRWIVYCHIAFKMLENQYFRIVLFAMDASIASLLPATSATLRNWVKDEYKELAGAISNIHLSFDIWTSPSNYSIISIFGNFINEQGQRRRQLLAFRRIYGCHNGENISKALLTVIHEYSISEKIGYLVSDNAQNNDTATTHLLQQLYPHLSEQQRVSRRLRCFGHITNLCARALLLGKGAGKALSDLERKQSKGDFAAVDRFWKGKGALGQLHNIIRYIRSSPQRLEEFAKVKKGGSLARFDKLKPIQSNTTRWNSAYLSVSRALDIKERLIKFWLTHRPTDPKDTTLKDNALTHTQWHQLSRIQDCLKVFEVATADTEGRKRHLFDFYSSLSWMLDYIDAFRVEFAAEAVKDQAFALLSECCSHSWKKIEKYYIKCDQTPILFAAIVLHPARKHRWFRDKWDNGTAEQRTWASVVKVQVEDLWRSEYKATASSQPCKDTLSDDEDNLHVHLHRYKRIKLSVPATQGDALEAYLEKDLVNETKDFDPLQYWYQRRHETPDLARFAFDTLAIPLMSDDPERSFSAARDMITYRRSNLNDDIIEACACLRSWYGPPKKEDNMFDKEKAILEQYATLQGQEVDLEDFEENNISE